MCGVLGVSGRPATIMRCLGVTATLLERASLCLGVEGVTAGICFRGDVVGALNGELVLVGDNGSRVSKAPCLAGAVLGVLARFLDGVSSAAIFFALTALFCGVMNGFAFSPSS